MSDLFEAAGLTPHAPAPLAERLRPHALEDVVGQDHLLGEGGPIRRMIAGNRLGSMILWGPPGTGKTTIARLLARAAGYEFQQISAVFSGVADLKKAFEQAKMRRAAGQSTLLFVDEIHRFNRAQQDGFLPFVEEGTITLVGATTENPSFELNGALLSRCQVYVLRRLDEAAMEQLLARAEAEEGMALPLEPAARETPRAKPRQRLGRLGRLQADAFRARRQLERFDRRRRRHAIAIADTRVVHDHFAVPACGRRARAEAVCRAGDELGNHRTQCRRRIVRADPDDLVRQAEERAADDEAGLGAAG